MLALRGRAEPLTRTVGHALASTSSAPRWTCWARWDSDWYLRIAESGYSWPSSTPAFFPLYPLLVGGARPRARRLASCSRGSSSRSRPAPARSSSSTGSCSSGWDPRRRPVGALPRALPDVALPRRRLRRSRCSFSSRSATFVLAERGPARVGIRDRGPRAAHPRAGNRAPPRARRLRMAVRPRSGVNLAVLLVPVGMFLLYPLSLEIWVGHGLAFVDAQKIWERSLAPLGPLGGLVQAIGEGDVVGPLLAVAMLALAVARLAHPRGRVRRSTPSPRWRSRWPSRRSGSAGSTRSRGSRSSRSPASWRSRVLGRDRRVHVAVVAVLAAGWRSAWFDGRCGTGSPDGGSRARAVGWAILVVALAMLSYAANIAGRQAAERRALPAGRPRSARSCSTRSSSRSCSCIARGIAPATLGLRRPASWPRAAGLILAALVVDLGRRRDPERLPQGRRGAGARARRLGLVPGRTVRRELRRRRAGRAVRRGAHLPRARVRGRAPAPTARWRRSSSRPLAFGLAHGLLVALPVLTIFGAILALAALQDRQRLPVDDPARGVQRRGPDRGGDDVSDARSTSSAPRSPRTTAAIVEAVNVRLRLVDGALAAQGRARRRRGSIPTASAAARGARGRERRAALRRRARALVDELLALTKRELGGGVA